MKESSVAVKAGVAELSNDESVYKNIAPRPVSFDVCSVKIFTNSEVMKEFVSAFLDAIRGKLTVEGGSLSVTEDEVKAYLHFAVYARVRIVNGPACKEWGRHDKFRIPSFLAVCLAQIGKVERADIGVQLVPEWGEEAIPAITPQNLGRVNAFFGFLEDHGFEMVIGLPKDTSGSLAMMSLHVVEGHIRSTTAEYHPSFAVMAGFFGVTGLANVLGAQAFRVSYGTTKQIGSLAYLLTGPKH